MKLSRNVAVNIMMYLLHCEKYKKPDEIAAGNGNSSVRVKMHKDNAIKHLDLMHEAIKAGNYKKAMHHKVIANVAIDEMVSVSDLVENHSSEYRH